MMLQSSNNYRIPLSPAALEHYYSNCCAIFLALSTSKFLTYALQEILTLVLTD